MKSVGLENCSPLSKSLRRKSCVSASGPHAVPTAISRGGWVTPLIWCAVWASASMSRGSRLSRRVYGAATALANAASGTKPTTADPCSKAFHVCARSPAAVKQAAPATRRAGKARVDPATVAVAFPVGACRTTQALLPPKPNELDRTVFTEARVGAATGTTWSVGSSAARPVLAGRIPSSIATAAMTASMAPAAASGWPVRPLVDDMGGGELKTWCAAFASAASLSGVPVPCKLT